MNTDSPVLFYTDLSTLAWDEDATLPRLSPARREIVLRRPPKERPAAAYAELLLHYAARECGYPSFAETEIVWQGKPYFAKERAPFSFNLSHAGNTVAVLLCPAGTNSGTECPHLCGMDCEELRPLRNMDAIARKMFTEEERAWLDTQNDRIRAFFRLWTAKEAFIKYTGEGFSRPLATVLTDFYARCATASDSGVSCRIYHFETENAVLCAALDADTDRPPVFCTVPANRIP
ncbi:MAG: 4'-phosphopantetheinyl transferase superfamily protein [Clostridia bacterium]|nr:4'-phosphopantetheinyl transferase superfamily protein [Clostridia bacterium]